LAPSFSSSRSFTAYERLFPSESTDVQPGLEVDDLEDDYICMPDFVTGTSTTAWSLNDLSDLSLAHAESLTHPSNNTSSLIVRRQLSSSTFFNQRHVTYSTWLGRFTRLYLLRILIALQ
jgi:hypothetical protein